MKHLLFDGNNVHLENNFEDMKTKDKKVMKTKDRRVKNKIGIEYTISDRVRVIDDDPVFDKKDKEAAEFVRKHGLPDFPPRKK